MCLTRISILILLVLSLTSLAFSQGWIDPTPPATPREMKECDQFQQIWDERVDYLRKQAEECNDAIFSQCTKDTSGTCHVRNGIIEGSNWFTCGGESSSPASFQTCVASAKSESCAKDQRTKSVDACRNEVRAYAVWQETYGSKSTEHLEATTAVQESAEISLSPSADHLLSNILDKTFKEDGSLIYQGVQYYGTAKDTFENVLYWKEFLQKRKDGTASAQENYDASLMLIKAINKMQRGNPLSNALTAISISLFNGYANSAMNQLYKQVSIYDSYNDPRATTTKNQFQQLLTSTRSDKLTAATPLEKILQITSEVIKQIVVLKRQQQAELDEEQLRLKQEQINRDQQAEQARLEQEKLNQQRVQEQRAAQERRRLQQEEANSVNDCVRKCGEIVRSSGMEAAGVDSSVINNLLSACESECRK